MLEEGDWLLPAELGDVLWLLLLLLGDALWLLLLLLLLGDALWLLLLPAGALWDAASCCARAHAADSSRTITRSDVFFIGGASNQSSAALCAGGVLLEVTAEERFASKSGVAAGRVLALRLRTPGFTGCRPIRHAHAPLCNALCNALVKNCVVFVVSRTRHIGACFNHQQVGNER
jgi:hypothetical protein